MSVFDTHCSLYDGVILDSGRHYVSESLTEPPMSCDTEASARPSDLCIDESPHLNVTSVSSSTFRAVRHAGTLRVMCAKLK